jgi:hypothetical protein
MHFTVWRRPSTSAWGLHLRRLLQCKNERVTTGRAYFNADHIPAIDTAIGRGAT